MAVERVPYDEFGYFADNASEFGIAYDGPPTVRREAVVMDDGRAISSLVWGEASAELVLIHGGAQNAHTWDTVCLALDRPLIAIDMPGHGHSDGPADAPANVQRNAQDIAAVMRALAPDARTVVGMSLGGLTTMALSAQEPELFDTMVLVDMTPGVTRSKAKQIADFVNGPKSFENFDELLARAIEFNPTRTESSLRRGILHNAEQLGDGSWVWRHARHNVFSPLPGEDPTSSTDTVTESTPLPGEDPTSLAKGTDPLDEARHAALWDALENHDGPLVLARGMREQSVVDDADEAELRRRRPDARIEHFVEAGHSIQGDMPVELAALISESVRPQFR